MGKALITTQKLSNHFGMICTADNLDLTIEEGVLTSIIGPNGAGKTTTIRLLLGLLEPTKGLAEVLGLDTQTQADSIRLQCGALLEHNGLYERLSAEDNLQFYGKLWQIPIPDRQARIEELLTHLNLWERRKEPVINWSRGMKQKLAMARALLHRPALLFLDEPTAGLDPAAAAKLRDDLADLVEQEGVTVFLNTHNLAEAERLCHRIGIVRQGKLLADGAPGELRAQAGKPRLTIVGKGFSPQVIQQLLDRAEVISADLQDHHLTIQLADGVESAALVSLLVGSGAQVEEVIKTHSSLEDVFLNLVNEDKDISEDVR